MKRYALFAGEYHPSGGMSDYVESYDSSDEAQKEGFRLVQAPYDEKVGMNYYWWHVVDMQTRSIILKSC